MFDANWSTVLGAWIGLAIAGGLGFWAYSDAKALATRNIKVGSMSPAVWGWGVALLAIVFGVMYLVQRGHAVASGGGPPPDAYRDYRAPEVPAAFCTQCGYALKNNPRFCPRCGTAVG